MPAAVSDHPVTSWTVRNHGRLVFRRGSRARTFANMRGGIRLFDASGAAVALEQGPVTASPAVTHMAFRVRR